MSSKIEPVNPPLHVSWTKVALLTAGVIAYQLLVYYMIVDQPDGGIGAGLMVAPLVVVVACVLARSVGGRLMLGLLALAVGVGILLWRTMGASPALLYPVPFLTVYVFLLWFFGRTLKAERKPLVTLLAAHVHGEIPADIARYTRQVTWAWCIFFAAMALTSILLFVFEPLPIWSVFNNLLNLPLVVAMYLGEYAWRLHRFPDFPHASIATVFRAFRNFDFNRPAANR